MTSRLRRQIGLGLTYGALTALLAAFLFPVFWMISTSLKVKAQFFTSPPIFWPAHIHWSNYVNAMTLGAGKGFLDSLVLASGAMLFAVALGAPASYAIARYKVGGGNFAFWILSIRMFPPIATIIPLFLLYRHVHLIDTYQGLIIAYTVFDLPFVIWILKGFFEAIPREIEEAAVLDGASLLTTFYRVVLPVTTPGLVVAALFSFIFAWNDFIYALVFTRSAVTPLPLVIATFAGGHEILWGAISAAGIVAIVPAVLLALFLQRYLVAGLTLGAVRG